MRQLGAYNDGRVHLKAALLAIAMTAALASPALSSAPASSAQATTLAAPAPASACKRLDDLYALNKDGSPRPSREVSVYGRARTVRVHWDGRAPSRAAAALFAAALRHALRYRRVQLTHEPTATDYCMLAVAIHKDCEYLESSDAAYDYVNISPAMAWSGRRCMRLEACVSTWWDPWVDEPRLQALGTGAVGAALGLHALLAPAAREDSRCARAHSWTFYADRALLDLCHFTQPDNPWSSAIVYTLEQDREIRVIDELRKRIVASALHLNITLLRADAEPRFKLLKLLREQKSSFLFLDFDIWRDEDSILRVASPPAVADAKSKLTGLDTTGSLRVADDFVLRQMAPQIVKALQQFSPATVDLRQILELEASRPDFNITEATCAWAVNNTHIFESFQVESNEQHWIAVFICVNDPDKNKYKEIANLVQNHTHTETKFKIGLYFINVDCTNEDQLNNEYFKTFLSYRWQKLIGVVGAGAGMESAGESAPGVGAALVFYDTPAPRARLRPGVRAASGNVRQLASAIQHFLTTFKWNRLALLSENTKLAKALYEALYRSKLSLVNAQIIDNSTAALTDTLMSFQHMNARIIFVNTNAEIAASIICVAHKLGMTSLTKYAWILREWRAVELKCGNESVQVNHFTVSFWWRGGGATEAASTGERPGGAGPAIRRRLTRLWGGAAWPPLAAPLADALLLLITSFNEFAVNYTQHFYDLHGNQTAELLLESLNKQQSNGVMQKLQFINGTLAEPLVFIERWKNNQNELLIQLRIQDGHLKVVTQTRQPIYDGQPPTDGTRFCLTPTKDNPFFPRCRDFVLLPTLGCIAITALALFLARRERLKRLARRDSLLNAQLLAQREFVATALVDHYVDRAALELHHDLGHGCFGRVRYGILRGPDRPPVAVAVKELRGDVAPVEESELLREACTLATLRHEHVVRLIGVCSTGGPLLVLMEYAFFGDLQEYLLERRHFAERTTETDDDINDEGYHVSAKSLTRLAKQAACALEYLSSERLVHRDVRASNCLVDVQRSLKLADFGLARKIGTGLGGEADEYSCRRRGLFPVLWMAPESLERLVFTAASDAWSLGVLLLELVTLGARPYGAWPPLRVLRYVTAGGRPPLPPDASQDTRSILAQCWRSAPEERPTAAALAAQLEASPEALRPALLPVDAPTDEDNPAIDEVLHPLVSIRG